MWGPEALGRAGALRGQGHRSWAWVAPLLPLSHSGVSLQFGIHAGTWLHLGLLGSACGPWRRVCQLPDWTRWAWLLPPQRVPCRASGGGLRSREAPDIPFWGCGREAKRNVKRCLKAPRKPVGLSRSSICGKKPWHGAAGSTVKIDRGAEKRLNSGSQCPSAEEESLSKSRGGSAPLCCFPLNPSTKKRERDKS